MAGNHTFPNPHSHDEQLARQLQTFWPHRSHESGVLRSLLCFFGLHLWAQPDYNSLAPHRSLRFCLWCSTVEIDGVHYR
jgi:hypothetical protein